MAFVTFKSDYFGVHLSQDKTFCLQIPTRWSLLDVLFPHSTLTAGIHTPGLYLFLISDRFPNVQKLKATFYETSIGYWPRVFGHTNRLLNLNPCRQLLIFCGPFIYLELYGLGTRHQHTSCHTWNKDNGTPASQGSKGNDAMTFQPKSLSCSISEL